MAGQRSYYGNILTNVKDPVTVKAKIQMNGASAPTVTYGPGFSATHTGGSNDCVVTFPEKYGNCHELKAEYVPPSGHSAARAVVTSDYSATTGQATFSTVFNSGNTVNATTADNDPTGAIYVTATFALRA